MNLREAYNQHYDRSDLSRGRLNVYRTALKMWEKFTDNLPIDRIDNVVVAGFRKGALEGGYAPNSVNGAWTCLRAILRRVGPPVTGNPFGLGLIDRIPAMKRCKVTWRPPKRIALDDLDKFYVASRHSQYPMRAGLPAAQWWQTLLVTAYLTGLRKDDLLTLRFDQFDFERNELHFTAGKTGKTDTLPLHPAVVEHVLRIRTPRKLVFSGCYRYGSRFYHLWHAIQKSAGLNFKLHDVRRTAASEIDRVRPGAGDIRQGADA